MRPLGIARFALLYPIALGIDQAGSLIYLFQSGIWGRAGIAAPVSLIVATALGLTLWYFTVYRHSSIARWLVLALFVLNVLSLAISLVTMRFTLQFSQILSLVALVVRAVAVRNLFYGDTEGWFNDKAQPLPNSDEGEQGSTG